MSTFPLNPSIYQALFVNGAGISVTLGTNGSILDDDALDAIAQNNSALGATGTAVFFGQTDGSNYTPGDRGFLNTFASPVSAANWLTTEWNSTAAVGSISQGWGSIATDAAPLVINGLTLELDADPTSGGSWGSAVVPEPGSLALAGLALSALAAARAARRHLRQNNRPA